MLLCGHVTDPGTGTDGDGAAFLLGTAGVAVVVALRFRVPVGAPGGGAVVCDALVERPGVVSLEPLWEATAALASSAAARREVTDRGVLSPFVPTSDFRDGFLELSWSFLS